MQRLPESRRRDPPVQLRLPPLRGGQVRPEPLEQREVLDGLGEVVPAGGGIDLGVDGRVARPEREAGGGHGEEGVVADVAEGSVAGFPGAALAREGKPVLGEAAGEEGGEAREEWLDEEPAWLEGPYPGVLICSFTFTSILIFFIEDFSRCLLFFFLFSFFLVKQLSNRFPSQNCLLFRDESGCHLRRVDVW